MTRQKSCKSHQADICYTHLPSTSHCFLFLSDSILEPSPCVKKFSKSEKLTRRKWNSQGSLSSHSIRLFHGGDSCYLQQSLNNEKLAESG